MNCEELLTFKFCTVDVDTTPNFFCTTTSYISKGLTFCKRKEQKIYAMVS